MSESFVRNTRYQDPEQWRARQGDDEQEQYQAYKYQKARKQQRGLDDTPTDDAYIKANLHGKAEQLDQRSLRAYAQYRKEAKTHGSWAGPTDGG